MDIEGGNHSVHSELDEIFGMFKFALVRDETVARKMTLNHYFKTMRNAHTDGQLDDADLTWRLNDWKKGVKGLFLVSPEDALVVTSQALKACQEKEQMPVADKLIINTVCDLINICARPALLAHANRAGSFNLEHSGHYINHVKNVLCTTAPHYDSASFQLTYRDAITEFKKILFGSSSAPELPTNLFLVPPASRYQHVKQVHDWAKAQHPRCSALLGEMQEILFASTILENGQEIILHPKEVVADEWGREHYVAESNAAILEFAKEDLQREKQVKTPTVLSFAKASAARAGEMAVHRLPRQNIEPSEPCTP